MSSPRCGHCGFESPEGMKFCGGCGQPLATPEPDPDDAQRLHVTVMFCDLVGSTQLVATRDPEDYRELLAAYQRLCEAAVARFEGWAAQWAGDGLVAYFGYPRAHEDDAQRAIHAGLAIVSELEQLGARLHVPLQARVGLHSGVVVAGELGTGGARMERAVIGTTPHVAARLQSLAAPGAVVISDAVHALIGHHFELEPFGEHDLKGVPRPVAVHRVLKPTGAVGRIEVVGARPVTRMVGREAELAQLTQAWTNATQGRGGIVHMRGEAGIGKSRLVRALTERAGGAHVWQCSSHHRSTALYPVIQWLEHRLGVDRAKPVADQLTTITDAGLEPKDLAPLLGLPYADERSPIDARADALRAITAFLAAEAAVDPLLLVVEDLHWADPTTIELLSRIAHEIPLHPALCVVTYRREFEPPWTATRTIELGPLSAHDVQAMVAANGVDMDLSVADGVPLFVEELLKMIAAGGGTFGDRRDSTTTNVPPTLQGLLTQRLERLRAHRDVIDVAAVLGRDFEIERVAELVPLGDALEELTAQDVIRPVESSPGRFEFSHALLHEAAYTRLLRVRRRALHRRVAELLTPRLAEREPEIVAHHWRRAGEAARSVPYWLQAGEQAINRAAFLEAVEHLRGGLEALDRAGPDAGDRAEFLVRLAGTLQAGVGYAAEGVDEAYAQARRLGVGERVGVVGRGQWAFHLLRAEYDVAAEFATEQLALGLPANGHMGLGMVHLYRGEFELARTHLTCAYEHYTVEPEGDWLFQVGGDSGVGALAYNSTVLHNLGEIEDSLARSDLSLELAERIGGPVTRAQAWGMRALLHLARSEPAEFARWTERTRRHSVFHNVGYWRALASLLHGALRARAGELDQGRADVDAALDAYIRSGSRLGLSRFYVLQAELRMASGELDGAFAALAEAEEHVAATGEHYSEVELHRFKGRLLTAAGDADGATAAYERAVAVAREQRAVMLELRAATTLAAHNGTGLERVAELCARFPAELELDDLVKARGLSVPA